MAPKKPAEAEPTETTESADEKSIWERIDQPRTPRTLEHGQIAAAAVALADEHGLDAVSMRRLASDLGVATMALYRYVSSKEDVLWLMVDAVAEGSSGMADQPEATDWRTVIRRYALDQRAVAVQHPWLFEAGARIAINITPNRLARAERTLASLEGLGLDPDTQLAILTTVGTYVWGAAGGQLAQAQLMRRRGWATGDDLRNAYSSQMRWLMGTGRYPHYARMLTDATRKDDSDWRFEFGLDCVIEGIATRLNI
jgi:AcrR family transcriptional regulator